jgi:hypothetical protein
MPQSWPARRSVAVSLPIAQGARPPATATAAPDEIPATRPSTDREFLGVPKCRLVKRRRRIPKIGLAQSRHAGRGQIRMIERRSPSAASRHKARILPWSARPPCRQVLQAMGTPSTGLSPVLAMTGRLAAASFRALSRVTE